ncbi:MAG: PIN domain-containing protein [Oscillospiraceae bacterium]|nr:PIN domain-containing protein [Oscillospiraceae bacterium]
MKKNTRVLIDTNVLIDYINAREPFWQNAKDIFKLCEDKAIYGCVAAHSIINIMYVLRKDFSPAQLREILVHLCAVLYVVDVTRYMIIFALENDLFGDFEDFVQAQCAQHYHAEYIVTRNCSDFRASPVPALTPEEFLALF